MSDLDEMLSHFVRAQLYLAAISGAVYLAAAVADAGALRIGAWDTGRPAGVHSICRPGGGWSRDSGRQLWIELRPSADGAVVPADLARLAGLRYLSAASSADGSRCIRWWPSSGCWRAAKSRASPASTSPCRSWPPRAFSGSTGAAQRRACLRAGSRERNCRTALSIPTRRSRLFQIPESFLHAFLISIHSSATSVLYA